MTRVKVGLQLQQHFIMSRTPESHATRSNKGMRVMHTHQALKRQHQQWDRTFCACRMRVVSMVLTRGFPMKAGVSCARHCGHSFLHSRVHFRRHSKQKLCWQGAVTGLSHRLRQTQHFKCAWSSGSPSCTGQPCPSYQMSSSRVDANIENLLAAEASGQ